MVSLLPLLLSTWWWELDRPHNFGVGFYPDQVPPLRSIESYYNTGLRNRGDLDFYYRPFSDIFRKLDKGSAVIDADTFKVIVDVQQFKPDEVKVKLVGRSLIVEAKHEERQDEHGFIARQFLRRYRLPDEALVDQISSNVSSDGLLTIIAPLDKNIEKAKERHIKVEYSGKPSTEMPATKEKKVEEHSNEKENSTEKESDDVTVQMEEETTTQKT